jgi:hypothetical protein
VTPGEYDGKGTVGVTAAIRDIGDDGEKLKYLCDQEKLCQYFTIVPKTTTFCDPGRGHFAHFCAQRPDASHGNPYQYRFQQRSCGYRHTHRRFRCCTNGTAPEAFVLAVLFGANMSYATPMAYKINLIVMNAGNYHFNDFLRIGVPLVLIMWFTLSWLLPAIYGIGT